MALKLGVNRFHYGGAYLNENVLRQDNTELKLSTSINRAVVDHMVYYLRNYFSGVIFTHSSTSGNTSVTIKGKYPETYVNSDYPAIIVLVQSSPTNQEFLGDVSGNDGEVIYSRLAQYEMQFDVWGRTVFEVDAVVGSLSRIFDDANHDTNFMKRGFSSITFMNTLGREFDISDKIVQTVSHLDSSINIRREQLVYRLEFRYKIALPKELVGGGGTDANFAGTFAGSTITVQNDDGTTLSTITLTPKRKVFFSESLLRAV